MQERGGGEREKRGQQRETGHGFVLLEFSGNTDTLLSLGLDVRKKTTAEQSLWNAH